MLEPFFRIVFIGLKLSFTLLHNLLQMKKIIVSIVTVMFLCSCGIFGGGSRGTGCPSNGRAVGAEKLAAGDPKAMKDAKKAPKFKFGN